MKQESPKSHERLRATEAGQGASVGFPTSAVYLELMRMERKRAADRPAIEEFKRARLEAHRRILAECGA